MHEDAPRTADHARADRPEAARPAASAAPRDDLFPVRTRGVLLDMDGTLIDSGPSVERAWAVLFEELGSDRRFGHDMHGRPARQVLAEIFPGMTEDEMVAAHRRIEEIEIADVESILVLPGTARILRELDAAAEQLGRPTWTIVTSCTRPLFEARWATTGLPAPDTLVTADQVSAGKPDSEPFRTGAERLGLDPADTLAVEDSIGGLRSARGAGSHAVAITSTTPAGELREHADALITSLDDLAVHVEGEDLLITRR